MPSLNIYLHGNGAGRRHHRHPGQSLLEPHKVPDSYSLRPLSAPEVFHFGTSVRPSGGQSPSSPVFAVNLICDNVERCVLSDIQMNGSFTAERGIVAGFVSPVSGFSVAPPPRTRRHLFLPTRPLSAPLSPAILPPFALKKSIWELI